MVEIDSEIECADAVLSGTLCLPAETGRFPCVLMLPGSGPVDRDGNIKGQRLDAFNTIARHLAAQGFASLRYDKRGCGKSTGDYLKTGYFDFVADAATWFDYLRNDARCTPDRIYVLGHSEGAATGMHLSLQRAEVAGIVQLCPGVEDMEPIILKQVEQVREAVRALPGFKGLVYRAALALSGGSVAAQKRLIERVKSGQAQQRELKFGGLPYVGVKWFREFLQLDMRQVYAQVRHPILLIAGAKDVQCDPVGVPHILEISSAPIEAHVVANLTHVLRFDDQAPSVFRYPELIKKPVEPEVLNLISDWLRRISPPPRAAT